MFSDSIDFVAKVINIYNHSANKMPVYLSKSN